MIPLEEFKKILKFLKLKEEPTEEQILKLRDQTDRMAEALFLAWVESIRQNKD